MLSGTLTESKKKNVSHRESNVKWLIERNVAFCEEIVKYTEQIIDDGASERVRTNKVKYSLSMISVIIGRDFDPFDISTSQYKISTVVAELNKVNQ